MRVWSKENDSNIAHCLSEFISDLYYAVVTRCLPVFFFFSFLISFVWLN